MDSTRTASLQQEQQSSIMSQSQPTSASPQSSSSPSPSPSSSRPASHKPHSLSLDLSDLPPLITPSPPSNTLLITNLLDASIFHPASLATIRENVARTAALHSFSPLRSFRRIVASFYSVDDAVAVRRQLDGEDVLGARVRVFFGAPTPVDDAALDGRRRHLAAPQADKLFFISPPPSPPHGWEMRNEEPPNKDVHADDLAQALAKLHSRTANYGQQQQQQQQQQFQHQDEIAPALVSPISPARTDSDGINASATGAGGSGSHRRLRSSSTTIVYHPEHHGDSPNLPAVMVEDTTNEDGEDYMDEDDDNDGGEERKIMAHTARPPVELMD